MHLSYKTLFGYWLHKELIMDVAILDLQRNPDTGYVSTVVFAFSLTKDGHTAYYDKLTVSFEGDNSDADFVAYDSLTHATVAQWVKAQYEQSILDEIEDNLEHQISTLNSESHGVPWTLTGLYG